MRAPPSTATRLSRQACVLVNNPHSVDTCQQWVGLMALALFAGQRSAPHGLFECSSVDATWAATAAADHNRISPCHKPRQTGSHILQGQSLESRLHLCLRDRNGIGTQMYVSGTVAGPRLAGAGRVRESCFRERARAKFYCDIVRLIACSSESRWIFYDDNIFVFFCDELRRSHLTLLLVVVSCSCVI